MGVIQIAVPRSSVALLSVLLERIIRCSDQWSEIDQPAAPSFEFRRLLSTAPFVVALGLSVRPSSALSSCYGLWSPVSVAFAAYLLLFVL